MPYYPNENFWHINITNKDLCVVCDMETFITSIKSPLLTQLVCMADLFTKGNVIQLYMLMLD